MSGDDGCPNVPTSILYCTFVLEKEMTIIKKQKMQNQNRNIPPRFAVKISKNIIYFSPHFLDR